MAVGKGSILRVSGRAQKKAGDHVFGNDPQIPVLIEVDPKSVQGGSGSNSNRDKLRKVSDKQQAALVKSVKTYGVLEPVLLWQDEKTFYLVTGQKRLEAAITAGLSTIPARIMNLPDKEAYHKLTIHLRQFGQKGKNECGTDQIVSSIQGELPDYLL